MNEDILYVAITCNSKNLYPTRRSVNIGQICCLIPVWTDLVSDMVRFPWIKDNSALYVSYYPTLRHGQFLSFIVLMSYSLPVVGKIQI